MVKQDQIDRLRQLFESVQLPVNVMPCDEADRYMPHGVVTDNDGRLNLLPEHADVVLTCPCETPGGSMLLRAAGLLAEGLALPAQVNSAAALLRQIMLGRISVDDAEPLIRKYRIPIHKARRVLQIRLDSLPPERSALALINDLIPMGRTDYLIEIDRCTVAYIRDSSGEDDVTEAVEFTLALCETVEEELGFRMIAGISETGEELNALQESYRQAGTAAALGQRFCSEQQVWAYERLLNERFISDLPDELCRRYHTLLVHGNDTLDDELMRTAVTFQSMDLNIAETSRKMGIHRNTLLYRLDKIQNLTGLDIRKFDDAMSFRLMAEMGRRLRDEA